MGVHFTIAGYLICFSPEVNMLRFPELHGNLLSSVWPFTKAPFQKSSILFCIAASRVFFSFPNSADLKKPSGPNLTQEHSVAL